MIKIERTAKPEYLEKPHVLDETEEAKKLFDPSKNETEALKAKQKKFKYKNYNNDKVKEALKIMCHDKCAYCESSFLHVYYGDIEHFRPKKFVGTKKNPIKPGYYWLANNWDNLLLSCLFCNQAKRHEVAHPGVTGKVTLGKQNHFPLDNENLYKKTRTHKSWKNQRLSKEEKSRLLIDPCKDNPEQYLKYTEEGLIVPRKIKKGSNEVEAPRGKTSIEVYGLQRLYLVQERKKRLIDLKLQISIANEIFKKLNNPDFNKNPVIAGYYSERLKESIDLLFRFTHKTMHYSAMCRQFVYDFLKNRLNRTETDIQKAERTIHKSMDNV